MTSIDCCLDKDQLHKLEDLVLAGGRQTWIKETQSIIQTCNNKTYQHLAQTALYLQTGRYTQICQTDDKDIQQIFSFLINGETSYDEMDSQLSSSLISYINDSSLLPSDVIFRQAKIFFLAIALLNTYVALNWTQALITDLPFFPSTTSTSSSTSLYLKGLNAYTLQQLRLNGEDVYEQTLHPYLLYLSHLILNNHSRLFSHSRSLPWWRLRLLRIHQDLMEQNSNIIYSNILSLIPQTQAIYNNNSNNNNKSSTSSSIINTLLRNKLNLECCHLYLDFWQYNEAAACLTKEVQQGYGLSVEITGIMGKRTKWQIDKKSQLVVQVYKDTRQTEEKISDSQNRPMMEEKEVKRQEANLSDDDENHVSQLMPIVQELDSDVLLPSLALDVPLQELHLTAIQRALLLSLAVHLRRVSPSRDITVNEQLLAFTHTILSHPKQQERSWAIESAALYLQSLLELTDHHKQDRALGQLEDLSMHINIIAQRSLPLSEIIRVRMEDIYYSSWPSQWRLKLNVAHHFEQIALIKSALDVYESIQYYDGIMECYVALGRKEAAEELIRKRLNEAATPKLYCLLGDVLNQPTEYERAWELSQQSYPRAQRSLAKYYRDRQQYTESIKAAELALSLNPVFPLEWFGLGCCALELHDYDLATTAFTKTITYDPEYGNGWNNLAAAHLYAKHYREAFGALEQAIRINPDSWKQWENYLNTAMKLQEWQKAIIAVEKVVQMKNKERSKDIDIQRQYMSIIDRDILQELTNVIAKELDKPKEEREEWLIGKWLAVLNSLTSTITTDPNLWNCLSRCCLDENQVKAYREKAYRSSLLPIPASYPSVASRYSAFQYDNKAQPETAALVNASYLSWPPLFSLSVQMLSSLCDSYIASQDAADLFAAHSAVDSFLTQLDKHGSNEVRSMTAEIAKVQTLKTKIDNLRTKTTAPSSSSPSNVPLLKSSTGSSYLSMWK